MARGYVTRRGKMWYAFWVDSEGNTRSKSVSMQESEARLFLERRKMEVDLARRHDCKAVLFEQAAEEYIARVLPTAYKPSTVVNMTSDLKAHLIPFFKDAYVCEISARDLDSYIAERIIDERASSGKTVREINTFRQFMNTAVTWRYASYNPGYLVKLKARNVNSISFLRPVELKSLFEHAHPAWRPYLMTAGLTGMRCGELAGLFERDVDFAEHKIRVRRSVYAGKYDTPKTAAAIRDIDMPPLFGARAARVDRLPASSENANRDLVPVPVRQPPDFLRREQNRTSTGIRSGRTPENQAARPAAHLCEHTHCKQGVLEVYSANAGP